MLLLPATAALMVFLGTAYVRKKHETGRKEIGYKVSATLMAVIPALCLSLIHIWVNNVDGGEGVRAHKP